jgi:hypothetical protein
MRISTSVCCFGVRRRSPPHNHNSLRLLRANVQRPEPISRVPVGAHQLRDKRTGPEPAQQLPRPLQADRGAESQPSSLLRGEILDVGTREHPSLPLRNSLLHFRVRLQLDDSSGE